MFVKFNYYFVPCMSCVILFWYLVCCSFSLNSSYVFYGFIFDELSLFIVYMLCFVIFISFIFSISFLSSEVRLAIVSMLVICFIIFITNNMFYFYLFYEASLVPILYIIIKWGSYPERSVSSIILLIYTAVFTFPFLYVIMMLYLQNGTFVFNIYSNYISRTLFFSLLIFLSFAVKLPIYGLHFWLPMAHVEAPTFGSIILAGVLLKLGGVGLIRFSCVMDILALKKCSLSYFLVFLSYVTFVCCFQSDFKRLVAYSSVSHIITIPIILFSSNFVGFKGIISVIFLHGLSSPLLFMLVGVMYSFTFTRQHLLMRGLLCFNPLLSFLMVLAFFFTLSAPPFPSFLAEIFFTLSAIRVWSYSFFFVVLFLFLSIVYNLLWLTSINFLNQRSQLNFSFSFTYRCFIPIFMALFIVPMVFTVLFCFVF